MLNIGAYSALLEAKIKSKSYNGFYYNGSMLPIFTLAVATGVVNTSLSLKGIISAPLLVGPSTGIVINFSDSNISQTIRTTAISLFNSEGAALKDFCDAIGDATKTHFLLTSLTSDTNGSAKFPAFSGAINQMTAAIIAAAPQFKGSQWPNFARAIATGICQEIGSNGSGTLIGASGTGTGSGIVNIT